ncbi:arginine metabolism regulation protein II [Lophiotrema nucula]|uniref:Arginine metabolism regulation protein II n=1 Tax=Lophiotrema nucula TaxID=690887 RepID=A0A6A5YIZ3_9PLEO|nr:arginine metabolism regulation protein II [Lophiotrema nucula]
MDANTGRTRSFGGCATCRSRHMKCDEGRPACSLCIHAGITCGGYDISIFFDFEEAPDPSELRFRRPLLTEIERKCMSEWLTSSVPPAQVPQVIARIEEEGEESIISSDFHIRRGPFGAFRLAPSKSRSPREAQTIWDGDIQPQSLEQVDEAFSFSEDFGIPPETQELIQTVFGQPSQYSSSELMESWNVTNGSGRIHEIFDNMEINMSDNQQPWAFSFPQATFMSQSETWNAMNVTIPSGLPVTVPHDAISLLKHYSTTVLRSLTPFRHSKTPWHILFIPHVKNCLAALTLGEAMEHASLCSFYGTLAISAFSLGGVSVSPMWLNQGRSYKQQAREQARLMLKTAYDVPKTAKYKSVLMALLTMVQLSMVSGNRNQTECYLVEAEKFIRVKGLKRRKSRKVRLLHHCYAFERMFHESIFVAGTNSSHRHHVRKAIELSGAKDYSQDSLSFNMSEWSWSNLEEAMLRVKGREEGENDLHLQLPGVWDKTLYPEIFGVPEQYVFLLSLTIRLVREKERTELESTTSVKEFLIHAKAVERCINQLQQSEQAPSTDRTEQNAHLSRPTELNDILPAMQTAMSIYFYRRVYDINTSLLQQKVTQVRDCLMRYESSGAENAYGTARLVWPAFVAASEADDLAVQCSFSQWFKVSATRSGLHLFTDALTNLERIWEGKRNVDGSIYMRETLMT